MVTRRLFLLVGILVLFIDDDETEIRARSEDCGPRADDSTGPALSNFMPFIMPLTFAEMGMKDGNFMLGTGEARLEPLDRLRCEGDFRYEHDGGLPAFDDELDCLEI